MKEPERFYEFRDNSSYNTEFAWAVSILPRSEMIERRCPQCGNVESYPSGAFDVIVEDGSRYPDILGCGAYPFLIVSEKVVTVWHDAHINCFHTHPVGVATVKSQQLQGIVPPLYFRIEIDGRCQIDLAGSGITVISLCPECHHLVTLPRLAHERRFRIVPNSWDGCPLFRDSTLFPRVNFCTQLVLDLAQQYQFTNFRFEQIEHPLRDKS